MDSITLDRDERPAWADINAYMNIKLNDKIIGSMGLVSLSVMNECKIKHTNVMIFELDFDELIPLPSRTNKYETLPIVPLVEKDLSLLLDEKTTWKEIEETIKKRVYSLKFIEEYRGNQIPDGKKSITLRMKLGNGVDTMKPEEIEQTMNGIIRALDKRCGATLREELLKEVEGINRYDLLEPKKSLFMGMVINSLIILRRVDYNLINLLEDTINGIKEINNINKDNIYCELMNMIIDYVYDINKETNEKNVGKKIIDKF